jgi:xanthine dehydrogenase accessory factor
MIIRSYGAIIGTIGGGILEAQVQDLGREVLRHKMAVTKRFAFSAEDAADMGMICGGELKVLVRYVDACSSMEVEVQKAIAAAVAKGRRAWLITGIPADDGWVGMITQSVLSDDGSIIGELGRERILSLIGRASAIEPRLLEHEGELFLVEPLCHHGTVVIFGAGHIGQALVPLIKHVGFKTVVLDDRAKFANRERFQSADRVLVVDSFEDALKDLDIDGDSYLVIVTRGHAHDKTVLSQALRSGAGYIGMIGSRAKRGAIYAALEKEGFSLEELQRVHCPIGLSIGAESPEEIAVSIVAELIQARAGKRA